MSRLFLSPSRRVWLCPLVLLGCSFSAGTSSPAQSGTPQGSGKPAQTSDHNQSKPTDSDPADGNDVGDGNDDAGSDGNDDAGTNDTRPTTSGTITAPTRGDSGGECGPAKPCPEGQGCNGLFHDKGGVCIPEAQAKAACAEKGGEWGEWGMRGFRFCNPVFDDAGKTCTDGSQCKSETCIVEEGTTQGKCQKYELHYGCYSRMSNGKVGPKLCVD